VHNAQITVLLQQQGWLKAAEPCDHFFRVLVEIAVETTLCSAQAGSGGELKLDVGSAADKGGVGALAQLGGMGGGGRAVLNFRALDALSKLVTILVKYFSDSSSANTHLALLHRALVAVLRALCQKHCRHPCSAMRGDSRTRSSAPLRAPVPGVELLVRRALHGKAK